MIYYLKNNLNLLKFLQCGEYMLVNLATSYLTNVLMLISSVGENMFAIHMKNTVFFNYPFTCVSCLLFSLLNKPKSIFFIHNVKSYLTKPHYSWLVIGQFLGASELQCYKIFQYRMNLINGGQEVPINTSAFNGYEIDFIYHHPSTHFRTLITSI